MPRPCACVVTLQSQYSELYNKYILVCLRLYRRHGAEVKIYVTKFSIALCLGRCVLALVSWLLLCLGCCCVLVVVSWLLCVGSCVTVFVPWFLCLGCCALVVVPWLLCLRSCVSVVVPRLVCLDWLLCREVEVRHKKPSFHWLKLV